MTRAAQEPHATAHTEDQHPVQLTAHVRGVLGGIPGVVASAQHGGAQRIARAEPAEHPEVAERELATALSDLTDGDDAIVLVAIEVDEGAECSRCTQRAP